MLLKKQNIDIRVLSQNKI